MYLRSQGKVKTETLTVLVRSTATNAERQVSVNENAKAHGDRAVGGGGRKRRREEKEEETGTDRKLSKVVNYNLPPIILGQWIERSRDVSNLENLEETGEEDVEKRGIEWNEPKKNGTGAEAANNNFDDSDDSIIIVDEYPAPSTIDTQHVGTERTSVIFSGSTVKVKTKNLKNPMSATSAITNGEGSKTNSEAVEKPSFPSVSPLKVLIPCRSSINSKGSMSVLNPESNKPPALVWPELPASTTTSTTTAQSWASVASNSATLKTTTNGSSSYAAAPTLLFPESNKNFQRLNMPYVEREKHISGNTNTNDAGPTSGSVPMTSGASSTTSTAGGSFSFGSTTTDAFPIPMPSSKPPVQAGYSSSITGTRVSVQSILGMDVASIPLPPGKPPQANGSNPGQSTFDQRRPTTNDQLGAHNFLSNSATVTGSSSIFSVPSKAIYPWQSGWVANNTAIKNRRKKKKAQARRQAYLPPASHPVVNIRNTAMNSSATGKQSYLPPASHQIMDVRSVAMDPTARNGHPAFAAQPQALFNVWRVDQHGQSGQPAVTQPVPLIPPASSGILPLHRPVHAPKKPKIHDQKTTSEDNTSQKLRPIIIDGSNVAMAYSLDKKFDSRGILLCAKYFLSRGHPVRVFVPQFREEHTPGHSRYPTVNGHMLTWLYKHKMLTYTPHRTVVTDDAGKPCKRTITCYDDYFIIEYAHQTGGVIVSKDSFRDVSQSYPEWARTINNRLLMFSFAGDMFMVPRDPLGPKGPNIDQFLRYENGEKTSECPAAEDAALLVKKIDDILAKKK